MIDTLMALWNRGYGGRGILVTIAFSLICISISLLLVSAGSSWFSSGGRGLPAKHINIISAGDLTATAQSNNIRPVADNTVTIYSPTATVTANPCPTTFVVSKTPLVQANATRYRGSGHYRPTPTPHHSRTTPTPVKATPTATTTPRASVTATIPIGPTVIEKGTIPPHLSGGTTPITTGTVASGQNRTSGGTDCSHNKLVDSVGLNADGSVVATIERHFWIILGGSTLGTLCFYIVVYVVARKRGR